MDRQGFLHGRCCKRCGTPLQGEGSGRPAESYAGTYTGLCYPCTSTGAFLTGVYRDGAEAWSWPPSCPSWRRDRERYIKYPDCTACDRGSFYVSRSDGEGGSYRKQCGGCVARYDADPLRTAARAELTAAHDAAQARYTADCKAARKRLKLTAKADLPDDVLTELRAPILRDWETWQAAYAARLAETGVHAFTPAEVKQF